MENVVRQELQAQESALNSKMDQSSWKRFFGLQQTTMEEKYREQCTKELQKLLLSRQQLDRASATHTSVVGRNLIQYMLEEKESLAPVDTRLRRINDGEEKSPSPKDRRFQ